MWKIQVPDALVYTEVLRNLFQISSTSSIASAILAECDYFISTDRRLLKYETDEIKVVKPIEFVTEAIV